MQSVFHLVRYHWRRAQWPCYSLPDCLYQLFCCHKVSTASLGAVAYLCLCASLLCFSDLCLARDTLNADERILDNGTSLVSAQGMFKLGFFSPTENTTKRYLGIWYHGIEPQTVVWVANRDNPVTDSKGVAQIAYGGNLVVSDINEERYWSSELGISSSEIRTLTLMDSGNLVLRDDESILWQSFDDPTDTFLPGMKMDSGLVLTSWRSADDPASGDFTFKLRKTGDYRYMITENNLRVYWQGGRVAEFGSEEMPAETIYLLTNSNFTNSTYKYFRGNLKKFSGSLNFTYTRLLMNFTGEIQRLELDDSTKEWNIRWKEPANKCKIHNCCGMFTSCNVNNRRACKCWPGFIKEGHSGYSAESKGCVRKSTLSCEGNGITFLSLRKVKVGSPGQPVKAKTETECQTQCRNMCPHCQAYSYNASRWRDRNNSTCFIWTQKLPTLQEGNFEDGLDLSIPVKTSDIAPTARTCQPCSTNIIPYPLSTGPNCGDPMYMSFNCSEETGQLSFKMPEGSYPVTSIDPDKRKLSIKIEGSNYCDEGSPRDQPGFPFSVTDDECFGEDEIDINWHPPQEPPCNNSTDCKDWPHSTCNATKEGTPRCLCDSNYMWDDLNLTCTQEKISGILPPSLILVVTLTSTFIVVCILVLVYLWRRKIAFHKDSRSAKGTREHMYDSERQVKDLVEWRGLDENDSESIRVPYFDFESILEATDNFSDVNKLGRGGYGPVYKGKFRGRPNMAVKRLSSVSSQGLEEFENEIVLIAKLQHRNLVRLQGYCIKGGEKILLYEYMPNKSLDLFIFDRTQRVLLDWKIRFDIILGVARGMMYLHQDSRLRVVHRDLKTSNILLDEEMNPKISDFGLAKIIEGKETEASTQRIVGTYGYMSPEYALDGFFSIKSDVFSFGVVLLEIISGKKNTGFYEFQQISSLLGYAWRLWTENKILDLMDPSLLETCNADEFVKCAQVGLLCVQDEPGDRPTMSNVVLLLESETATLPTPKQPTFFMSRGHCSKASSSSKPEMSLQIESSYLNGR